MNFSDFTKSQTKNEQSEDKSFAEKNIKETYDQLKGLSNDQLSKRLYDEVYKQKQSGTFDYEMLSKNIESIKSFIPNKTYEDLKRLLNTLK